MTSPIEAHRYRDVAFFGFFALGFAMNVMRRVAFLIRDPHKVLKNRREYIYHNWDMLSIRLFLDGAVIFWPVRHVDVLAQVIPSNIAKVILYFPQYAIPFALLGFFADNLADLAFSKLGAKYPFLREDFPVDSEG